jgi:NAD(P)H-dependent FMN reductase
VIVGTSCEGRFSEKVTSWVMSRFASRDDIAAEPTSRDHPLPFFDQLAPPAYGHRDYSDEVAAWAAKVEAADAHIVVTAEYNHGYPALLKNALDHVFPEVERIIQHSLPLEDARAFAAYGQNSTVGKILEIHQEQPGRIHVVLIRQSVGF